MDPWIRVKEVEKGTIFCFCDLCRQSRSSPRNALERSHIFHVRLSTFMSSTLSPVRFLKIPRKFWFIFLTFDRMTGRRMNTSNRSRSVFSDVPTHSDRFAKEVYFFFVNILLDCFSNNPRLVMIPCILPPLTRDDIKGLAFWQSIHKTFKHH